MEKELSAANMERYFVFTLQDDDTYAVKFFNRQLIEKDEVETLVIPSTYNGKPVTVIGEYAFSCCIYENSFNVTVKTVTEPNDKGEEEVAHRFAYIGNLYIGEIIAGVIVPDRLCEKVKSVVIPDSVTSVGDCAFSSCKHLISIKIGNGIKHIGNSAFNGCASLKEIQLPNGITELGIGLFGGCKLLAKIDIPDSVIKIDEGAFTFCESLTELKLPDSVTQIGYGIIEGCSALKSICFGDGITELNRGMLVRERILPSVTNLSLGKGVNKIDYKSDNKFFDIFPNLSSLSIDSSNLTYFAGNNSFCSKSDMTLLKCFDSNAIVTVPDGIINIDEEAFFKETLIGLVIPTSVKQIGKWILHCGKFKTVYYKGTKADWKNINISSWNYKIANAQVLYANDWNYAADGITPEINQSTGFMGKLFKKLGLK